MFSIPSVEGDAMRKWYFPMTVLGLGGLGQAVPVPSGLLSVIVPWPNDNDGPDVKKTRVPFGLDVVPSSSSVTTWARAGMASHSPT